MERVFGMTGDPPSWLIELTKGVSNWGGVFLVVVVFAYYELNLVWRVITLMSSFLLLALLMQIGLPII